MKIEQFEDKGLSHYSYAILSEWEHKIVLIDPSRDIEPYLDYAEKNEAKIVGVIETHPHADFVSGHLELHERMGATTYCSKLVGALYPHQTFDDGDHLEIGKFRLNALNTPGHSPDSICIVLEHEGVDKAVFTGDTLFIGDCGRPDLREKSGNVKAGREQLARQMYHSLREKLMTLNGDVLVYPAHGAGTLCGKDLSEANSSTIKAEKVNNWSLQEMTEEAFVKALLEDQPFIPKYFPFDVELNKKGAERLSIALGRIKIDADFDTVALDAKTIVIDSRPAEEFRKGHLPSSINLMVGEKFETWLGSIISPGEYFYLSAENEAVLTDLIGRCAKIGYEGFIKAAFISDGGELTSPEFDLDAFKKSPSSYTIVDVRNYSEVKEHSIFSDSIDIPLGELRERVDEIPLDKPIVVHCAGGYRSAVGSSIIESLLLSRQKIFNMGLEIVAYS